MENPFPKPYPEEPVGKEERSTRTPSQEYEPRIPDLAEENIDGFRTFFVGAAIILVIVILAGFGGWYFFRDKSSEVLISPVPAPVEQPSSSDENNLFLISAINGGTIAFENFRLTIPPGALAEDTAIEISREAIGPITDLFYLKPHGLKFLKPVKISIPYKEEGFLKGENPESIRLEYWSGEDMKKKSILAFEVDEERKVLETEVLEL